MASPISHIIYAKKYFEKNPSNINKDEFILGCLFPDIRRVSENIKRKDTHIPDEILKKSNIQENTNPVNMDFTGLTAFQAGWKFHIYCDMKREEILKNKKFYSLEDTSTLESLPAKYLEDEILYDQYNNWEKIYLYFNNAPEVDLDIYVPRETFEFWYAILAKYIERKPDKKSQHIFFTKQFFLKDKADEIVDAIEKLRKNEKVVTILKNISEEILK
jgi:hypothetical protein